MFRSYFFHCDDILSVVENRGCPAVQEIWLIQGEVFSRLTVFHMLPTFSWDNRIIETCTRSCLTGFPSS